jgi:imidazolonepropionase-like amidohydrolase
VTNARLLTSPDASPIQNGSILVRGGRIAEVGDLVRVPAGLPRLDAGGASAVAGFWNCHVHFTERGWGQAARASSPLAERLFTEMLTSHGFTSAIDTGSNPRSTFVLRQRVAAGEIPGPAIYSAGTPLYPPRGIPYYLRDELPWWVRQLLPQPRTPHTATRAVERSIRSGADIVKLFTGSWVERGRVVPMPEPVAAAAVAAAHRSARLVFAHPSNREGVRVAVSSQVDVLAHAPDDTEGVDDALLRSAIEGGVSMVPTLKLFAEESGSNPEYLEPIYGVVRRFQSLGGELLFGTDVGYLRDHSTEGEFRALARAGVSGRAILRMLTAAPARRFGLEREMGTLAPGKWGDLVLLRADPLADVGAFARVQSTIRLGRLLWDADGRRPN